MRFGQPLRAPLVTLTVLLLTLILPPDARAAPEAGMVTRTAGRVQLLPAGGGAPRPADLLQTLLEGDRLVVATGGNASVVLFNDGHSETVASGTYRVTTRGLEGPKVTRSAASRALAGLQTGTSLGEARGASTTRAKRPSGFRDLQLAPAARVARSRPIIGLPEDSGSGAVRTVAIATLDGKVLESKVLAGERCWIPTTPLQPGTYQVILVEEGGALQSLRPLVVLPEDSELAARLVELEQGTHGQDPAPWVLVSVLLERQGLLEAALEASWQAQLRQPSPTMLRWSADLARRLGRPAEAGAWERLAERMQPAAAP